MHLSKTDRMVVAICALVLGVASLLLYLDRAERAWAGNAKKEGVIAHAYRNVQRKFAARAVWEYAPHGAPIYNNDWARTGERSTAVIVLMDKTKIELDPFSMIVLRINEKETNIDLIEGSVLTRRSWKRGRRLNVKSGGRVVSVGGGDVRFSTLPKKMKIVPAGDRAGIVVDGRRIALRGGQRILLTESAIKTENLGLVPRRPADGEQIIEHDGTAKVRFSWDIAEKWKVAGNETVVMEISDSREFKKTLYRARLKGNGAGVALPAGLYFWRISAMPSGERQAASGHGGARGREFSETRKFSVVAARPAVPLTPGDRELIEYRASPPRINFSWMKSDIARAYLLQISRDRDFKKPVLQKEIARTAISIRLGAGGYHWRLRTIGTIQGADRTGPARSFRVVRRGAVTAKTPDRPGEAAVGTKEPESTKRHAKTDRPTSAKRSEKRKRPVPAKRAEPGRPRLLFPRNGAVVDMSKRNSIPFRWRAVRGAARYEFHLYRFQGGGKRNVFQKITKRARYRFTALDRLDTGKFYWTVRAYGTLDGGVAGEKAAGRFVITLSEKPDRPELILPKTEAKKKKP